MTLLASSQSKRCVVNKAGFGLIEVIIVMAIFSVALSMILTINLQTHRQSVGATQTTKLRQMQSSIYSLVMDGQSWYQTSRLNGAPVGWDGKPTVNMALPPYVAIPPQGVLNPARPPLYLPGEGGLVDLYDAAGVMVINSRQPAGFTIQGVACGGPAAPAPSAACPVRWETRWFIPTNASNPLIYVTVTLQVAPGTTLRPAEYSFDFASGRPLMRGLFNSWVNIGPRFLPSGGVNPRFAYASFTGMPNCTTFPCANPVSFTNPGAFCGTEAGSYLRCTGACAGSNGSEQIYRCQ